MTEEEMENMTVADWEKYFEKKETQPGTIEQRCF